jgi:galactokinase
MSWPDAEIGRTPQVDGGYRIFVARAPGRVNLIGDPTDYNEGVALPMAIDLHTEVHFTENDSDRLLLYTSIDASPADLPLEIPFDRRYLDDIDPAWARLPAAIAAQAHPVHGGIARITGNLPVGAGLSSSASVSVALAMAFGVAGLAEVMAVFCQRAEAAIGSNVGQMDPLVSAAGRAGHGLLIDFSTMAFEAVPMPEEAEVVVVHSGVFRDLRRTPYAARRAECEAASIELGFPLGKAEVADVPGIHDPSLRRRARHVITECERVRAFADALVSSDLHGAGQIMNESHYSLADDFAATVPEVDALVGELTARPGVYGARMTGGGFGGCVVALTEHGALDPGEWPERAWVVHAADGATLEAEPAP